MDFSHILSLVKEFLVLILLFGALFAYGMMRGKRSLISLTIGLYFAFLISLKFPYYDAIYNLTNRGGNTIPILTLVIFAVFTAIGTILLEHLLSYEYQESAFEEIPKKAILAVLGTILILAFSYHVLPVTTFIDLGDTISTLFAPPEYFFWFLIIPLLGLFFV